MILNRQRRVPISLPRLNQFLERVCAEFDLDRNSVTVCFVNEKAIGRMNRTFRNKLGPTDVLSFPSSRLRAARMRQRKGLSYRGTGQPAKKKTAFRVRSVRGFLGDVAISPETARRNARHQKRSLSTELRVLIVHGVLHLLGYDHEVDGGEMRQVEMRLRRRLGIA